MTKNLVSQGAMVVGLDTHEYFKRAGCQKVKCLYPAGDFEILSVSLQKKYNFAQYFKPILVGYLSGAALVYGTLAQAPENTFKGAISISFCPIIKAKCMLCHGAGLSAHALTNKASCFLEPDPKLASSFFVLQGKNDKIFTSTETENFVHQIPSAELVVLPGEGHEFALEQNWLPQFTSLYKKVFNTPSYTEKKAKENTLLQKQKLLPLPGNLPLTLIPAIKQDTLPMAFMISGDGGWTGFDHALGEQLAEKGMPVVGLDAQKYFWNAKTPEQATSDISGAIEHYMQQWNKKSFILIGYSFGACIAPFVVSRFSASLKQNLKGTFCLSPDETADFEIHIADMLQFITTEKYNVKDELEKIKALTPVCIFGDEESMEVRRNFSATGAKIVLLPGNHHYNNNFAGVSSNILKYLKR